MARQYKTARGKKFNMTDFADSRADTAAVGNMNVNAKGDVLGQGGHITKKREEVVREYYHEAPVQETKVSLKKETIPAVEAVETFVSPEEAMQGLMDQQKGTKVSPTKEGKRGPNPPRRGGPVKGLYAASEETDKKENNDSST